VNEIFDQRWPTIEMMSDSSGNSSFEITCAPEDIESEFGESALNAATQGLSTSLMPLKHISYVVITFRRQKSG
jgi:hypothetical protein